MQPILMTQSSSARASPAAGGKRAHEKGLNTLVLEAGRSIVPEQDYVEHVPSMIWKYAAGMTRRTPAHATYPAEVYYACMSTPTNFSSA